MLCRENELGWRLYKHRRCYAIRRAHPPLSSRIWQFGPTYVALVLVVFLWLKDAWALPYTLLALLILWISLWLLGGSRPRRYALASVPAFLILLGLLANNHITVGAALLALPLSVLVSLFLRPTVLYINVRRGEVFYDDLGPPPGVPFSHLNVHIDRSDDNQLYSVYLEDTETEFRRLAWESSTKDEADGIAEDLRRWGIGTKAAKDQDNVIKADKRACRYIIVGYIAATVFLLGVLAIWLPRVRDKSPEGVDLQIALFVVKVIIGFLFLSIFPLGLYLCRFGWRAIIHRRMPPPGTVVLVDTRIIEGKRAVTRGRIILALSIVLIGASLIGGLYFPHRLAKVFMEQIDSGTTQSESGDSGVAE